MRPGTPAPAGTAAGDDRRWAFAGWMVLAAVFANAWAYASTTANPLVSSDAWHFVETFVPKALDGTVGLGDLFAKRDGFDHAQPLHKLFLMVNARYLGLDFMYEALLGLLAGFAGILVMKRAADLEPVRRRGAAYWLPLAALAAVFLSLNSSVVFTWPLVTFGYLTILAILLAILAAWHAWCGRSRAFLVLAMAGCAVIADDSAILLAMALAGAFTWAGARGGRLRSGLVLAAIPVAVVVAYVLAYAALDPTPRGEGAAAASALPRLLGHLAGPEGWRVFAPFASGIAFFGQIEAAFGEGWESVQLALGLLMVAVHVAYWWRAMASRPAPASFMSITLMLLAYGFVAGVLLARVPDAGLRYLNEPRYAMLYQLQVVAMLLLALASPATATPPARQGRRSPQRGLLAPAAALVVLALQVPLSMQTWSEARYNRHYWRQMAGQMMLLSRDPTRVPGNCVANLVACEWDAVRRHRVMGMLVRYQLNLFSPEFRLRHGFVDR